MCVIECTRLILALVNGYEARGCGTYCIVIHSAWWRVYVWPHCIIVIGKNQLHFLVCTFLPIHDLGFFTVASVCVIPITYVCTLSCVYVSLLTTKGAGQVVVTLVLLISCYLLCCPCILCCCVDKDIKGMKCMSTSKRSLGNSCRPLPVHQSSEI